MLVYNYLHNGVDFKALLLHEQYYIVGRVMRKEHKYLKNIQDIPLKILKI